MAKDVETKAGKAMNLDRELSTKELKVIVKEMMKIGRPLMIWGQPGVGKSDLIAQIAEEEKRNMIDIRLLIMDPTDLRGIPYKRTNPVTKEEEMVWATPTCFPTDPNDTSIILLDEITAAPASVQAAALQLVLNRKIGEYKLPKGVSIVAAGNRETDKTASHKMPSALANRFQHQTLKFDFESWRDWAFANNIHPHVIGFLSAFQQSANTFDPKTNYKVFATPRTWAFTSQILYSDLPEELMMDAVAGTVGEGVMLAFRTHRNHAAKLPNPDDVLTGKVEKLNADSTDISIQHALSVSLIYRLNQFYQTIDRKTSGGPELSKKDWYKLADNFVKFLDHNFEPEIAMMAINICIKEPFKLPFSNLEMPSHKVFFGKNHKLFKGINSV